MDKSSNHTGLDLVAGGVLLGLGLKELLNRGSGNSRASRLDSVAGCFLRHATTSALTRQGCVQSGECQLASDPAAIPVVCEPERVLTVLDVANRCLVYTSEAAEDFTRLGAWSLAWK